jgi:soluble lytic murein transglycosylase
MTIRNFLVKTIPGQCCKAIVAGESQRRGLEPLRHGLVFLLVLACGGVFAQHTTPAKKSAVKAQPKAAPVSGSLAELVKAYRDSPTVARRAAVESWAAAHPKDRPSAALALGVAAYEQHDYARAESELRQAQAGLPQVADTVAYYLNAARVESKEYSGVVEGLAATHDSRNPSPYAGRGWLLAARALEPSNPSAAVRILREHNVDLPQPDGDLVLAECEQAAGHLQAAAETYQHVYVQYVTGAAAVRASTALASLRVTMGDSYPALSGRDLLRHADRLADAHEFTLARTEYNALIESLSGLEHDQARVRLGWLEYLSGKVPAADSYLHSLEVSAPDAEAERLEDVVETSRRLENDGELKHALEELESKFTRSPLRVKALISAANHYLIDNQPSEYLPLYRAVYEMFPADPVAGNSHWKVTFDAYLHRRSDAQQLLEEQLIHYPRNNNSSAALYFLGRAAEERKDYSAALTYYQYLTKLFENYYYAMLARHRMASAELRSATSSPKLSEFLADLALPAPKPVPNSPTPETTSRITRSQVLRDAGLSDLADAELRFGAKNGGQPALLGMEAARQADSPGQGLHLLKVFAPDHLGVPLTWAPRQFWELLYPLPYRAELFMDADAHGLDPYLVAGLIRQESEFSPHAVSPAKAYGLMQVLPVTGRQYARAAGIARFTTSLLVQPAVNLKIGTLIFRSMLDHSGGQVEQTLAAYNAGPMRLAEWVTWTSPHEPAEFIESIPFTETRDYVQAVLRNADMYRRLYPQ